MAECVVKPTCDTDTGRMALACNVHCYWAPCPLDGEPASPVALETWPEPSREAALAFWELRTKRQRPLVLHLVRDGRSHDGRDCWCGPEFFPAVDRG